MVTYGGIIPWFGLPLGDGQKAVCVPETVLVDKGRGQSMLVFLQHQGCLALCTATSGSLFTIFTCECQLHKQFFSSNPVFFQASSITTRNQAKHPTKRCLEYWPTRPDKSHHTDSHPPAALTAPAYISRQKAQSGSHRKGPRKTRGRCRRMYPLDRRLRTNQRACCSVGCRR